VSYGWKRTFIKIAQNVFHETQEYASTRLIMHRCIRSNMLRQLEIVWQAFIMLLSSASSLTNRTAFTRGFKVFPVVKIQRIQICRAWMPYSRSYSTYPFVSIRVIENTSYDTAKMYWSTTTHVPRSCFDCRWYNFRWLWYSYVNRCGNRWGAAKQVQTILATTIMLNCCWCLHDIRPAVILKLSISRYVQLRIILLCRTSVQNLFSHFNYTL
jgi:hypothetical protein